MSHAVGHFTPRPFSLIYLWQDPRQHFEWRPVRRHYATREARDAAASYVGSLPGVRNVAPVDAIEATRKPVEAAS